MEFDHTKLKKEDFTFTYGSTGYQIIYKGKRIGGAGTGKIKGHFKNCSFYREQAEITVRDILEQGRCPKFMKQNIIDINNGSLDWLEK